MNYSGLKPWVSQVEDLKCLRYAPGGHLSPSLKARDFLADFIIPTDVTFFQPESTIWLNESQSYQNSSLTFNRQRRLLMNQKRWILLAALTALAVIGFSMVSYAGRHFPAQMAFGPMYRMNLLSEELGLTDNQQAAIKKLFKHHRQEIQPLVKTVIAKKRALLELVLAENPDQTAIRQASADLGQAIADAAIQSSLLAQQAQSLLTPDQLRQFREIRQNRQKAFDETLREWQAKNPAF